MLRCGRRAKTLTMIPVKYNKNPKDAEYKSNRQISLKKQVDTLVALVGNLTFENNSLKEENTKLKQKIAQVRHQAAEIAIGDEDNDTKHRKIININV